MNCIVVSSTVNEALKEDLSKYFSVKQLEHADDLVMLSNEEMECAVLDLDQAGSKALFRALQKISLPIITLMSCENSKRHLQLVDFGAEDSMCKKDGISSDVRKKIELIIESNKEIKESTEVDSSVGNDKNINSDDNSSDKESYFRDIVERVRDGLWVRSLDDRIVYSNAGFSEIWGLEGENVNEVNWTDSVHPDDKDVAAKKYFELRKKGEAYKLEYRIVRPNGEVRWIENKAYPIRDSEGKLLRRVGVVRDLTVTRELESELQMAQKLDSLGQLSAGIAHEINTPCQYVSDNLSFLIKTFEELEGYLKELPQKIESIKIEESVKELDSLLTTYKDVDVPYILEEFPAALTQSKDGIDQIKTIVQAMKGFAHPGDTKVHIDLNDSISNTITVARNEWKAAATLETCFDESLPLVSCIPSAVNQVILNLIVNASQAIADNNQDGQLGEIKVSTESVAGEVRISISDTGPGIPEEFLQKIFDPFFTTKEVGKGTGQGLSISRKIVTENLKGTLSVQSTFGEGATFVITIPIE